jgi:hypothetical protein
MHTKDAFPSKFLQSADVKTKPTIAAISHVEMQLIGLGPDQKEKPVLHLDDGKLMVLNRTNFETLEEAFGDSDDWPGHKIKIRCARTSFQGRIVDGLRVEPIGAQPAEKKFDAASCVDL